MEDIVLQLYLDIRMLRKINRVCIFPNDNEEANKLALETTKLLKQYHFEVVNGNYDLAIAIGGDGSFLRMLKENNFNTNIYYVGINAGTLGFLQEIKPSEIELFIARLNNNDFKKEEISIQETIVKSKNGTDSFLSLNEIVIRDKDLNTTKLNVFVDDNLLEAFVGDGLLISTSIGSTAYNLSFGGSIVYSDLHTLQITPIAPLSSKVYHSLINSVLVPESKVITITPHNDKNNYVIFHDGTSKNYRSVISIVTKIGNQKISCLRMNNYSYSTIINEKFLK